MNDSDPADVHTGTDRVELTEDERATLEDAINESLDTYANASFLIPAVESIVAARVAALTAEREELRKSLDYWVELWKKAANGVIGLQADLSEARAELAAANARCAELEAELKDADLRGASGCAHFVRANNLQATLYQAEEDRDLYKLELDTADAVIERVTALADEWDNGEFCAICGRERGQSHARSECPGMAQALVDLRAALASDKVIGHVPNPATPIEPPRRAMSTVDEAWLGWQTAWVLEESRAGRLAGYTGNELQRAAFMAGYQRAGDDAGSKDCVCGHTQDEHARCLCGCTTFRAALTPEGTQQGANDA